MEYERPVWEGRNPLDRGIFAEFYEMRMIRRKKRLEFWKRACQTEGAAIGKIPEEEMVLM